jgi:Zn-dependent peptidase ImmA (M78 family)
VTLKRGFRADGERRAIAIRGELGLAPTDPLDLRVVAERYNVRIVPADELVDRERLLELERLQAFSFSACTFDIDGSKVIVVSPLRSPGRQNSDIGHEFSHLLLDHELTEVREIAGVPFRTCRSDQEEEATNLAGILLLPRPLLLRAAKRRMTIEEIAEEYVVTIEMARFRMNTTGVARQMQRSQARRTL